MRFAFIEREKARFPVRVLCRALGVTRSGYYASERRLPCRRAEQDRRLVVQLRVLHAEHRHTYGRPRLHRALQACGIRIGEKRVRRLMRMAGVTARGRSGFLNF